jgi:hypothetical protein
MTVIRDVTAVTRRDRLGSGLLQNPKQRELEGQKISRKIEKVVCSTS